MDGRGRREWKRGRRGSSTHLTHPVALDALNWAQVPPHVGRSENWAWALVMARMARVRKAVNVFILVLVGEGR